MNIIASCFYRNTKTWYLLTDDNQIIKLCSDGSNLMQSLPQWAIERGMPFDEVVGRIAYDDKHKQSR